MLCNRCLRSSVLDLQLRELSITASLAGRDSSQSRRALSTASSTSFAEEPAAPRAINRPKAYYPRPPSSSPRRPGQPSKPLTRGGHTTRPSYMRPNSIRDRKKDEKRIAATGGGNRPDGAERDNKSGDLVAGSLSGPPKRQFDDKKTQIFDPKRIDPFKVAQNVQALLEKDKVASATDYVRNMAKYVDVRVSYNYLIKYNMKKNEVNKALKIYNEMKKRDVKPDSYTMAILLEGLAINVRYGKALEKALSLYHAMSAPGSPFSPTIVHVNAVLKVCARAKDMDALWSIAQKMPRDGHRAPNSVTYTTILNGLRTGADQGLQKAVSDGMHIWDGIVSKWNNGLLEIDEELVCAMGRLLLKSQRPEDWDEVLTIFQNHFDLPRLLPRLGTKARQIMSLPSSKMLEKQAAALAAAKDKKRKAATKWQKEENKDSDETGLQAAKGKDMGDESPEAAHLRKLFESEDGEGEGSDIFGGGDEKGLKPFTEVVAAGSGTGLVTSRLGKAAKPSNNALSLAMESCATMRAYSTALEYWDLLTGNYGVKPDMDNYQWRLRVLAELKDNSGVVSVIEEMEELHKKGDLEPLNPKSFLIAMSACRRKATETAFSDAVFLLDRMAVLEIEVKPQILSSFIYLALVNRYSRVMKGAWDRLGPQFYDMKKLTYPQNERTTALVQPGGNEPRETEYDEEGNVVGRDRTGSRTLAQSQFELLRNMVRLADIIVDDPDSHLSLQELESISEQRDKYHSMIKKFFNFDSTADGSEAGEPSFMQRHKIAKFEKPVYKRKVPNKYRPVFRHSQRGREMRDERDFSQQRYQSQPQQQRQPQRSFTRSRRSFGGEEGERDDYRRIVPPNARDNDIAARRGNFRGVLRSRNY